jgi:GPH family glycoside/pentoside/hexuronide:cation symporter
VQRIQASLSNATAPPEARSKSGRWRWLGYAFGDVGIGLGGIPTNLLFLFYLTEIVGLRAGLAGLALALPKIWDVLVDPALGGWTDRLALRLGGRAPIVLVSGAAYVVALVLMFSLPGLHSSWQIVGVATLLLMTSSTAQTAFGVSQLSLATEMTKDAAELTSLLSMVAVVATMFVIAGTVLVPLLVGWSGGGRAGYSRMAAEISVGAALAILVFVLATRRVPLRRRDGDTEPMPLIASLRATGGNHLFYYVMAYLICFGVAAGIVGAFLPFANRYVLHGDQSSLAVLAGVQAVFGIAGLPLAPVLVRRFGVARAMWIGNAAAGLSLALLFAASFGPIWLSWMAIAGVGLGVGALAVVVRTTLVDVAQLKLKNGIVVPLGFYLGILLAGLKLGASAGSFSAGELLDLIGFVSGGAHQSATTISWLRIGYTLIPFGLLAIGGLFLRRIRTPSEPVEATIVVSPGTPGVEVVEGTSS